MYFRQFRVRFLPVRPTDGVPHTDCKGVGNEYVCVTTTQRGPKTLHAAEGTHHVAPLKVPVGVELAHSEALRLVGHLGHGQGSGRTETSQNHGAVLSYCQPARVCTPIAIVLSNAETHAAESGRVSRGEELLLCRQRSLS